MKSRWKIYLIYAGLIILGGGFIFLLAETFRAKNTGFETKTLWDWMDLLVIPVVLAVGAFYLNRSERAVERQIAENRANLEREIASDRQKEDALQTYIDRMAELLIDKKLRTTEIKEVQDVARTRTITVMRGMDPRRNSLIIQFLREANLVIDEYSILKGANLEYLDLSNVFLPEIILSTANLDHANLQKAFLPFADMQMASLWDTNLQGAILTGVNLQQARLWEANLQEADFREANLQGAELMGANLQGADLKDANLQEAVLRGANLQGADLSNANLQKADMSHVNLQGAIFTNEQLATVKSLQGAIMPDGTKHEQPSPLH
jgi:uncharacterized protein YjbI with pentapeptide repeats